MKLALFGNGGHAREVAAQIGKPISFYVDEEYIDEYSKSITEFNPKKELLMIAVANSEIRKEISLRLPNQTKYFTFIHPSAQILSKDIIIGEGSFIGANSILTTNISIGRHALLNRSNQIGHDSKIGDFFSTMPGSIISGNVTIGNCVYLGTNVSINQGINLTSSLTVGSGAVVTKDLPASGTYIGVPAKIIL